MAAVDRILEANAAYDAGDAGPLPAPPRLHLAVVTCMDARLDPASPLGLTRGDAHVIRNAGGIPTDDVLRSLAISQRALDTREVAIVQHTRCGMSGFDDRAFRAELRTSSGTEPGWDVPGFTDLAESVRQAVRTVRECPWLEHRDHIRGFVYDIDTAALTAV